MDLTQNSGILRGSSEHGFFFLHLTVQEFLAAGAIAKAVNQQGWEAPLPLSSNPTSARKLISRKAWDPRWQEVITLLAGQIQTPGPLLQLLADAKKDDIFRSRLAVAAQCLPEVQPALASSQAPLLDAITSEVCSLWFRHRQSMTDAAVPHLTRALPALGQLNGRIGKTPLLQWLTQQLREKDREVRAGAVEVLGRIGELAPEHPDIVAAYETALQDEDALVCSEAIAAVTRLGKSAAQHSGLMQALTQIAQTDPQRLLRSAAAKALETTGATTIPKAEDAPTKPKFNTSLSEDFVPPSSPQPLTTLVTTLYTAEPGSRAQAADVLGRMGARAAEHQEALTALVQVALHDVDNGVRSEAMRALAQIGEVAAQHSQVLNALALAVQNDRDAGVRAQAARALEHMASVVAQHTDLLPNLLTALRDEDTYVRYRAAIALARVMAHGVRFFRRWWGKIEAKRVEDLL